MNRETRTFEVDVQITIADNAPEDLFTRVQTEEFRKGLYNTLNTKEDVLDHFAFCGIMGYDDISSLDGWADVPDGTVTMRVTDAHPW